MTDFQLDTSGNVRLRGQYANGQTHDVTFWPDLSPFAQGYVEGALASLHTDDPEDGAGLWLPHPDGDGLWYEAGFSDLAPETLAAMLRDCEAFLAAGLGENDAEHGRRFWQMRVTPQVGGGWHPGFPPLTLYLGDDGRLYQREAR